MHIETDRSIADRGRGGTQATCLERCPGVRRTKEWKTMGNAPFMYWVGMNTAADTSPQELAEFNDFYSHTHMHEVVASHPGFMRATRYELCDPDPRGDF